MTFALREGPDECTRSEKKVSRDFDDPFGRVKCSRNSHVEAVVRRAHSRCGAWLDDETSSFSFATTTPAGVPRPTFIFSRICEVLDPGAAQMSRTDFFKIRRKTTGAMRRCILIDVQKQFRESNVSSVLETRLFFHDSFSSVYLQSFAADRKMSSGACFASQNSAVHSAEGASDPRRRRQVEEGDGDLEACALNASRLGFSSTGGKISLYVAAFGCILFNSRCVRSVS